MQERVGAPAVVERRPAHDHESEGLVEFARCSVLLIDVNRERATKAILRMAIAYDWHVTRSSDPYAVTN